MKERPIIFSGQMVNAILERRKTQTRRIVKPQPPEGVRELFTWFAPELPSYAKAGEGLYYYSDRGLHFHLCSPYGIPGDRFWVRETWGLLDTLPSDGPQNALVFHRATDGERYELRHQLWRPSIHMPRWASRILLEITNVRVERVGAISEADAIAEGVEPYEETIGLYPAPWACKGKRTSTHWEAFARLWDSIHGKGAWSRNDWAWVLDFKRIDQVYQQQQEAYGPTIVDDPRRG